MPDYEAARREFSWAQARAELAGLPEGGINLIVAVAERTGIEVPERDYPQLATLNDAVAYLVAHRSSQ